MKKAPVESAEAGYRIAARLHADRVKAGWRPLGRKIGFTNRSIWPRYGVYEPIFGFVYDRTVTLAPENSATISLKGFAQPRMEPEICFGLGAAPPRSKNPAELIKAIEWVAHSVEIVQCVHKDWQMQVGDATAANGLHGALVVGAKVRVADIPDLDKSLPGMQVVLKHGARVVDRGVGANVLDSPLLALAHVIELLAALPAFPALAAGEIVSTGTLTDAAPVAPGETWSTDIADIALPGLRIRYE